jgi:hypothetical protein
MQDIFTGGEQLDNNQWLPQELLRAETKWLVGRFHDAFLKDPEFTSRDAMFLLDFHDETIPESATGREIWVPRGKIFYSVKNRKIGESDWQELWFSKSPGRSDIMINLCIISDPTIRINSEIIVTGINEQFGRYEGRNTEAAFFWANQILQFFENS